MEFLIMFSVILFAYPSLAGGQVNPNDPKNGFPVQISDKNPFMKQNNLKPDLSGFTFAARNESNNIPATGGESSKKRSNSRDFQRLLSTVVPKHYNLELKPELTGVTFKGNVSIKIMMLSPVDKIVLNAADLAIFKSEIIENGQRHPTKSVTYEDEEETVTFTFNRHFSGDAILYIEYIGRFDGQMRGFYRSRYLSSSGEERYAGVTQFQPTDARRCFPCWDEPAIKATFNISLIIPEDRIALSNMPIASDSYADGLRTVRFDTTPIMSTYLVAFVVGEYDYVDDITSDGVFVRVYTPLGKKSQGQFALDVAKKVLPFYREYFNISYPLSKLDLIAVADFAAGAMENWGLITFRETSLLVDPENTSFIQKQTIALTIAHEIAHQWFGNLVTMEWWTHLWLNEGYASFMEFFCVDRLFPEYDIWKQFATEMYTPALELDALRNSHPIEVEVRHPSEIDEIFDRISYNKGVSVIRMIHQFIGDESFRKGMKIYLKRNQYKNTMTEDLWAALEEASNKPVDAVMTKWVKQMGFPVVNVTSTHKDGKRVLTVTQEKFTANGTADSENYFWMIPITVSTAKSPNEIKYSTILDKKSMEINLENVGEADWVKINPGAVGYFRTRYSSEMLDQLIPAVRNQTLPPLDRLELVDDMFALAQAGRASTSEYLKLIESYRSDKDYTVWSAIMHSLYKLRNLLSNTDLIEQMNRFTIQLLDPIADSISWEAKPGESHLNTFLRSLILDGLITSESSDILKESRKRFDWHISLKKSLPADIRYVCYKAALQDGKEQTYEEMLKLYRATDLQEEKSRILRALGATDHVHILKQVINFAMSDEVRLQDCVFAISSVAINPKGRELAWEYFKSHWLIFLKRYHGSPLLAELVKGLTENFVTEDKAIEIESFFNKHEFPGTDRTVSQSVESIRLNAAWLKRDLEVIKSYMTTSGHDTPHTKSGAQSYSFSTKISLLIVCMLATVRFIYGC